MTTTAGAEEGELMSSHHTAEGQKPVTHHTAFLPRRFLKGFAHFRRISEKRLYILARGAFSLPLLDFDSVLK